MIANVECREVEKELQGQRSYTAERGEGNQWNARGRQARRLWWSFWFGLVSSWAAAMIPTRLTLSHLRGQNGAPKLPMVWLRLSRGPKPNVSMMVFKVCHEVRQTCGPDQNRSGSASSGSRKASDLTAIGWAYFRGHSLIAVRVATKRSSWAFVLEMQYAK